MSTNDKVFVFAHITKTGGTTLREHFKKHLSREEFYHLAKKGNLNAIKNNEEIFLNRPIAKQLNSKVIIGHEVTLDVFESLPHKNKILCTTFREPKKWLISRYNQRMNRFKKNGLAILPFDQWLQSKEPFLSQFDWLYARFFGFGPKYRSQPQKERLKFVKDRLNLFSIIFILDTLDEKIKPICNELEIPAVLEKKNISGLDNIDFYKETEKNKNLINFHTKNDTLLYQYIIDSHAK